MEAGRELDAQIAEKVMGYAMTVVAAIDGESLGLDFETEDWQVLPHYSTNIAAAWPIAEKLHLSVMRAGDEWAAAVLDGEPHAEEGEYHGGYVDCGLHDVAYAPTAPLAICRAALLAVSDT